MKRDEFIFYTHELVKKVLNDDKDKKWFPVKDDALVKSFEKMEQLPSHIRKDENGNYLIKITKCDVNQLSANIREHYFFFMSILEYLDKMKAEEHKSLTIEQRAKIVFELWRKEKGITDKNLNVPYENLSGNAKKFFKSICLTNKRLITSTPRHTNATTIDELVEDLGLYASRSANIYFVFNDQIFYSLIDNANTCYLKLTGMEKHQYLQTLREVKQNAIESLNEHYRYSLSNEPHTRKLAYIKNAIAILTENRCNESAFAILKDKNIIIEDNDEYSKFYDLMSRTCQFTKTKMPRTSKGSRKKKMKLSNKEHQAEMQSAMTQTDTEQGM